MAERDGREGGKGEEEKDIASELQCEIQSSREL